MNIDAVGLLIEYLMLQTTVYSRSRQSCKCKHI